MDREQQAWEQELLDKIYQKLKVVTPQVKTLYAYSTKDGKYDNVTMPPYGWTCGFWGGLLWWMYRYGKDSIFSETAAAAAERMDEGLSQFTPLGHDVGFQYLLTAIPDYNINGRERSRVAAIHAATILAGRFNLSGRYIRAWNDGTGGIDPGANKAGYAIIDCMMNLPLLYWASNETGDPRYKQIAMAHADTVAEKFIRDDGSSCHIVIFDPETGEVKDKPRGQGYAEGSAWSRGQGWAIYGFAMSYGYTGKKLYLEKALKVAEYFIKEMRDRETPPLDFRQPAEPAYLDASAGVIAACGMVELQKWVDEEVCEKLEKAIRALLRGAYSNCDFSTEEQSILQNCSVLYHTRSEHHIPLVYGDFYLAELLMKRRGEKPLY
ncbi:MAG: glycoside hydrolase family 88 protein [Clostridia bacterium]|nr:glycoside hydrolase family 88 protein [Clostridia bacterium]